MGSILPGQQSIYSIDMDTQQPAHLAPVWWKESVIYQIYPRSFMDSNGDGIGDLPGILSKLDYLQQLGIDVIWLSPVYQSPNDDNGYDISDYYAIMDAFGTMADFDALLSGIHERDMKLIMDLVVNHTSDEHEWFQQARSSKDNPYRDYYFWKPEIPNNWISIFGGPAWEYDATTGEYYLHLFTKKQPDLNWENPKVRQEIYRLMRFWLDKGVDGFRMDVIPMISKRLDFPNADFSDFNKVIEKVYCNGPRVHTYLQEMHREVLQHYNILTVGEGVGIPPELANLYVGADRKELNMIFHFGHMFIDHGPEGKFDITPFTLVDVKRVFQEWYDAVGDEGWVNIYLDNHDFPRMVSRFGHDTTYREASAKLLATLLLTLRGTPCIYYGSEIGMTNVAFESIDDYRDIETHNIWREWNEQGRDLEALLSRIHRQGRDNVRTPMQWNGARHGGFTTGTPWIKVNPNYPAINAEVALNDPNSIFYYYRDLLRLRKQHLTLVYGEMEMLWPEHQQLFAYRRSSVNGTYYVYLNFGERELTGLPGPKEELAWLFGNYTATGIDTPLRPWEARVYMVK